MNTISHAHSDVGETPGTPVRQVPGSDLGTTQDERFDRLIYGRVRLGLLIALAVNDVLTFNDLKALFAVTDGNIGAHARTLEAAGYV